MTPAHQRLEADDRLARGIDNRLIIELEFVALDRIAQILLKLGPLLGRGVQAVFEEAEHSAPGILGGIERQIDIADQHDAGSPVLRRAGDADRSADHHVLPVDRVRLREHDDDLAG